MARILINSPFFFQFLVHLILLSKAQIELPTKQVTPLFIFGDSYLDVGNNNYISTNAGKQANYWPYGKTYFNFSTGRFSDGRLIVDFIAELANLPLIPPFLQPEWNSSGKEFYGVNFASTGAGILAETNQGYVIDLKTQLSYYKQVEKSLSQNLGFNEAKMMISEAVYLFSIGVNDYEIFLYNSDSNILDFSVVEMVNGNFTSIIEEIYNMGGRKFVFINLPPFGCLPAMRILRPETDGACLEEATALSSLHNKVLFKLLSEMEVQLDGFKYLLFDFESSLQKRIDHPSKFGFKEGKTACCGAGPFRGIYSCGGKRPPVVEFELCENPNEYVFWESWHLTEKAYKQLAHEMWSTGVQDFFNIDDSSYF